MNLIFLEERFMTKEALKQHLRGLVNNMPISEPLAGEDLEVALGVLEVHPHGERKIGVGVDRIELRLSKWKNREFWLLRKDGEWVDFTWARCMDGERPDRFYQHAAMRHAIRGQIATFRRSVFRGDRPMCGITGDLLLNDPSTHIDHHSPTFRELADEFTTIEGTVLWKDPEPEDTSTAAVMADAAQRQRWEHFHRENAVLRAVTKHANLTRARTDRAA